MRPGRAKRAKRTAPRCDEHELPDAEEKVGGSLAPEGATSGAVDVLQPHHDFAPLLREVVTWKRHASSPRVVQETSVIATGSP